MVEGRVAAEHVFVLEDQSNVYIGDRRINDNWRQSQRRIENCEKQIKAIEGKLNDRTVPVNEKKKLAKKRISLLGEIKEMQKNMRERTIIVEAIP